MFFQVPLGFDFVMIDAAMAKGCRHKKINLPSNVITSIYLGMNINPENEVIINKAISLKSYRINLYKAIKVENKFKLSFERIN